MATTTKTGRGTRAQSTKRATAEQPAAKRAAAKPASARGGGKRKAPASAKVDLTSYGARVVSVFGPFASRVLVEIPAARAAEMFPNGLGASGRTAVVEAVERDLAAIRDRDPEVADSALAASAVALAYEIEHPYNSATATAACARQLRETLDRLRELSPPKEGSDALDRLADRLAERLAGGAAPADPPHT